MPPTPDVPAVEVKTNIGNANAVPVDTAVAVNATNGTLTQGRRCPPRRARSPAR